MTIEQDQPEYIESAWKALCLAEYAKFKTANPEPLPCFFWSGSAWFDAGSNHSRLWFERIKQVGDAFWAEQGFAVDWDASWRKEKLYLKPLDKPVLIRENQVTD